MRHIRFQTNHGPKIHLAQIQLELSNSCGLWLLWASRANLMMGRKISSSTHFYVGYGLTGQPLLEFFFYIYIYIYIYSSKKPLLHLKF